ncbi:MAG: GDP-mannose 4,6-dehydratase [Syntrophotaleaceae bacterium]
MKTVLVTGAAGFTGRFMTAALEQKNYHVIGLVHSTKGPGQGLPCDLTDAVAVAEAMREIKPDYVVHLAALSFVGHRDSEAFYRVNLFGTLHLLEALAALPVPPRKVLVASSANVYGTPAVEVIDESVCPAPVNHYANSKLAMEHMVRTWFDRLPILITRPFNYTGPGQAPVFLVPKIVEHFRRRSPTIELGNLDVSRDFSDVRDVVAAYAALLETDAVSETVNICRGEATPLRGIIDIMNRLAGYEIEVKVNPAFVRSKEISRLQGDNTRLKRLVGTVPSIPIQETLQWMLDAS